jgi:predicted AlkP superfamily pyrophosphatase or phosphodiesterase
MHLLRLLAFAVLAAIAAACATGPSPAPDAVPSRPVVMISLDGFRPDYLDRGLTPTLARLAREGVRASMRPSYPSLTFPNHYTLVTGLRPDRHGIVENTMLDPALGRFTLSDRVAVEDGRWWGGEPLWLTLERRGLRSASIFWPGTEGPIQGIQPHWWSRYDAATTLDARVDRSLEWLALPAAEGPRLVLLYIEHLDSAGHRHGPDSSEVDAALAQVDAALARLVDGLQRMQREVDLVIVSDHGMTALDPRRVVEIDALVALDRIDLIDDGPTLNIAPRPGHEAEVEAALLRPHADLACFRKHDVPARWHYGRHPRVAPIVCQLEPGAYALTRADLATRDASRHRGSHGYDPMHPDMAALFIAHGPAFAHGVTLPAFDNVHVYPLVAGLLGIPAAPNDGDPRVLAPALRRPPDVVPR